MVHGRPVRFVDDDDKADARAQEVLEAIARQAGFRDISFVYEPIAAAYHYERTVESEELVLIADIGGGTCDFSIIRIGPQRRERTDRDSDVLANAGVRMGGTDFDSALSIATVMPLLGLGTHLVEKNLPMPNALYYELATWATINFAYSHKKERELAELLSDACEPEKVGASPEGRPPPPRPSPGVRGRGCQDRAERRRTTPPCLLPSSTMALPPWPTRVDFERAIDARTDRLYKTASDCIARQASAPTRSTRSFSPAAQVACRPCGQRLPVRRRRPAWRRVRTSCPSRWD